ncbi:MAG: hypothetical protein Edafosvirus50_5, partial [Edafosvirus sp.]
MLCPNCNINNEGFGDFCYNCGTCMYIKCNYCNKKMPKN